jgi:integration host factor subunit alpha
LIHAVFLQPRLKIFELSFPTIFDGLPGEKRKVHQSSKPPKVRKTTTRADLLEAVYSSSPVLSRAQAREIFEIALEEISDALVRGESVKLRSFGLFTIRSKRERIGRNPRTGVEVPITPRRVLTFKPSPVLTASINGTAIPKEAESEDD